MDPDRIRKILPNDILTIIAEYLDPQIITLLNNKNRDDYFKKYMVSINFMTITQENIESSLDFLGKYYVYLKKYTEHTTYFTNRIKWDKIIGRIKRVYIVNTKISSVLNGFPFIEKISGHTLGTEDNLRMISRVPNDLIISLNDPDSVNIYRELGLNNLIYIFLNMNPKILLGLEDRIYYVCSSTITAGQVYPNLEHILVISEISEFIDKNLLLPNLKRILTSRRVTDREDQVLREKYPNASIYFSIY